MHAYWRAANYLSVGQIYLMDNPLLKEPLQLKHVKPRLLGHWGASMVESMSWRYKSSEHRHYASKYGDETLGERSSAGSRGSNRKP